jgi:Transposase DDE domain group 1
MAHPAGASELSVGRLDFDRRVRLEVYGSKISSDGSPLLFRQLDDVLGLLALAGEHVSDTRSGHNRLHSLVGRLAGYEDVDDAERLAFRVMCQIVGGRAVD